MEFCFYHLASDEFAAKSFPLPDGSYRIELWKPTRRDPLPHRFRTGVFSLYYLFHCLGLFATNEYAAVRIFRDDELIHCSVIFPKYFRFPCMQPNDLQIGSTWTKSDLRVRGLATAALAFAVNSHRSPGRSFWYTCERSNTPSARVAEKVGFTMRYVGQRTRCCGISALGRYVPTREEVSAHR